VVSMCVRQPALLSRDAASLAACLSALQELLGTTYGGALAAASRAPGLLLCSPDSLARRHKQLCAATGLPGPRISTMLLAQPSLLTLGERHIADTLSAVAEGLSLTQQELAAAVLEEPNLLRRGPRGFETQLTDLAEFLALPPDGVTDLLRRCPRALGAPPRVVLANISALLNALRLAPRQVQRTLVAAPALLAARPARLRAAAARVGALLDAVPHWRAEAATLDGRSLAALLRLGSAGLARLAFIVQAGRAGGLLADAALASDDMAWQAAHGAAFAAWLRERRAAAASGVQSDARRVHSYGSESSQQGDRVIGLQEQQLSRALSPPPQQQAQPQQPELAVVVGGA
jgi:hypothetical protein